MDSELDNEKERGRPVWSVARYGKLMRVQQTFSLGKFHSISNQNQWKRFNHAE
jgi:hypothetical protein